MVHTSIQHITSGINYMKITTEVLCTWPADDITIVQTAQDSNGDCRPGAYIGLRIDEVDAIIKGLIEARAQAIGHNQDYAEYERQCMAREASQLKEV
jgi:hypothetical protein